MDYQAVSPQDHLSPSYVGPINPSPFLSESEYGPIELNSIHTTTDVNSIGNLVLSNSENHSLAPPLWSIFEDSWLLEVIALVISAGALCGIYVLLKLYDGNQIPMWGPITLNALISVLSTLASICVLYAANNGISQLKWIWFAEKKQRLADLRTFDKASRGPKGALELLVKINIRNVLATLGALAVILAVGFDFFAQNLVHYYTDLVLDDSQIARVANNSFYTALGPQIMNSVDYTDPVLRSNIYNSLANGNRRDIWANPQFICNSGNCTWSPFTTLAVCVACSDITSALIRKCNESTSEDIFFNYTTASCSLSLPNSDTRTGYTTSIKSRSASPLRVNSVERRQPSRPNFEYLAAFQAIRAAVDPKPLGRCCDQVFRTDTVFYASECIFRPCVRSIQASVISGNYSEIILDTWLLAQNNTYSMAPPWGPQKGRTHNETYGTTEEVYRALRNYLPSFIPGWVSVDQESVQFLESANPALLEAIFYGTSNSSTCDPSQDNFICAMNNVADAMSKSIRDARLVANGTDRADMAIGQTMISATFVSVNFRWMALPLIVWYFGAVTWLGAVWKAKKLGTPWWRDNPLPLLYLYHNSSGDEAQGDSNLAYKRLAKRGKVRLSQIRGETKMSP